VFLLPFLARSAFAVPEAPVPCTSENTVLLPADGAVDVPLDVQALAVFTEGCVTFTETPMSLVTGDQVAPLAPTDQPFADSGLLEATIPDGLLPQTEYTLELGLEEEVLRSTFTTGTLEAVADPVAPKVALAATLWSEDADTALVMLDVQVSGLPAGHLALAALSPDAFPALAVSDADGVAVTTIIDGVDEDTDEVCASGAHRTLAGTVSPWVESCTPFSWSPPMRPGPKACSTTAALSPAWLALLLLSLIRRGGRP